ncbi:MAG: hypothetical protein ACKO3T_25880 [Planctomycetaceae bacterium]
MQFFLGGRDLEMQSIAKLLATHNCVMFDRQLDWGAAASAYAEEIDSCLRQQCTAVLVELADDLQLDDAVQRGAVICVDHHGARAGLNQPTSIEQIFSLLRLPNSAWSRHLSLVAANDRGSVQGMLRLMPPASREELLQIRAADRQAQGITAEQEVSGMLAASNAQVQLAGRLTIVNLVHNRVATVTDALEANLGGPGYQNLLIRSPQEICFFGCGSVVEQLRKNVHNSWCGGELPVRGYWGCSEVCVYEQILSLILMTLQHSVTASGSPVPAASS